MLTFIKVTVLPLLMGAVRKGLVNEADQTMKEWRGVRACLVIQQHAKGDTPEPREQPPP